MGFGTYDESEQEQPGDRDDDTNGEDVTGDFKKEVHRGESSTEDESTESMMAHL